MPSAVLASCRYLYPGKQHRTRSVMLIASTVGVSSPPRIFQGGVGGEKLPNPVPWPVGKQYGWLETNQLSCSPFG